MYWIWLIVMVVMIILIIKRGNRIKHLESELKQRTSAEEILKETARFKYIFKDREVQVHVSDKYEYEERIVLKKPQGKKPSSATFDYSKLPELNARKIESKYLYPKKDLEDESNYFNGKKIVITGIFSDYPDRNELAKLFWEAGADIDTGIGKNTQCLIIGEDAGPVKLKKAADQGIEIIYEDEIEDFFFR